MVVMLEQANVPSADEFLSIWNDESITTVADAAEILDISEEEALTRAQELLDQGARLEPLQAKGTRPRAYRGGHRYDVSTGLRGDVHFKKDDPESFRSKKDLAKSTDYALIPREPTDDELMAAAMSPQGRERLKRGFKTGPHLEILDRFYERVKKNFVHLEATGDRNAYLVIPSSTGQNRLSHMFAERLKKDFGGEIFDDYSLMLYLQRSADRSFTARKSMETPVRYLTSRTKLANLQGKRIILVDDSMNSSETVSAMSDALDAIGLRVSDVAVLASSSSPEATIPVEKFDLIADRMTQAFVGYDIAIDESTLADEIQDAFENQSAAWWSMFTRAFGRAAFKPKSRWYDASIDPADLQFRNTDKSLADLTVLYDYIKGAAGDFRARAQNESLREYIRGLLRA